jgi:hypothetical protein
MRRRDLKHMSIRARTSIDPQAQAKLKQKRPPTEAALLARSPARRVINLGGAIGFAGFLQKFFTFLAWGQLTGLFPREPSFLDEPFAYHPILFEPVALHERPPVVKFGLEPYA